MKDFLIKFLASGGFISHLPARLTGYKKFTGSGFAGTLVALALAPFMPENKWFFAALLAAFLPFSVWIAGRAEKLYGNHDDPRIVIDEIAGYWTAILFMDRTLFNLGAAFVFFRLLDTFKPWPIKSMETRFSGGFAIIVDDVLAGAEANVLTLLAASLYL